MNYELSNTLSHAGHVCFEKMPRTWEFTQNWSSLVLNFWIWIWIMPDIISFSIFLDMSGLWLSPREIMTRAVHCSVYVLQNMSYRIPFFSKKARYLCLEWGIHKLCWQRRGYPSINLGYFWLQPQINNWIWYSFISIGRLD